jgi:hypothetical protein
MQTNRTARDFFRSNLSLGAAAMVVIASVVTGHAATDVFATLKDAGSIVSGEPIVELTIPRGKYAIFAKINIDQDDVNDFARVTCMLQVSPDLDRNVVTLQSSGMERLDNTTVPFQIVQEFADKFVHKISLTCRFPEGDSSLLSFRFAKIMAIRLEAHLPSR